MSGSLSSSLSSSSSVFAMTCITSDTGDVLTMYNDACEESGELVSGECYDWTSSETTASSQFFFSCPSGDTIDTLQATAYLSSDCSGDGVDIPNMFDDLDSTSYWYIAGSCETTSTSSSSSSSTETYAYTCSGGRLRWYDMYCEEIDSIANGECVNFDDTSAEFFFSCPSGSILDNVEATEYASTDCSGVGVDLGNMFSTEDQTEDAHFPISDSCEATIFTVAAEFTFADMTLADYDEDAVTADIESWYDGAFEIVDFYEASLVIEIEFYFTDDGDATTFYDDELTETMEFTALGGSAAVAAEEPTSTTFFYSDASIVASTFISALAMAFLA